MFEIKVSQEIKNACPVFAGAAVYAAVKNTAYCEGLWKEINAFTEQLTSTTQMEDIKRQPVIAATREAYRRCGKDPGRYRPSAEALRRRLMRGIPLYQIDTLVDLINLVSLRTGHSIGGFDADKIQGTHLELGIGKAEEPFEGIGRGVLNIEGLPVYRDSFGGIGTLQATMNVRRWTSGNYSYSCYRQRLQWKRRFERSCRNDSVLIKRLCGIGRRRAFIL